MVSNIDLRHYSEGEGCCLASAAHAVSLRLLEAEDERDAVRAVVQVEHIRLTVFV